MLPLSTVWPQHNQIYLFFPASFVKFKDIKWESDLSQLIQHGCLPLHFNCFISDLKCWGQESKHYKYAQRSTVIILSDCTSYWEITGSQLCDLVASCFESPASCGLTLGSVCVSRLCCPKAVWVPVRKRRAKAAPIQPSFPEPLQQRLPLWSHEQPQTDYWRRGIGYSQRKSSPPHTEKPQSVPSGQARTLSATWWNTCGWVCDPGDKQG